MNSSFAIHNLFFQEKILIIRKTNHLWLILLLFCSLALVATPVHAQDGTQATPTPSPGDAPLAPPERVDVQPVARDEQIRERLKNILIATGWFVNPDVQVQNGVVFLAGQTDSAEFKSWAGDLARNTQDVVAVVNQIEVTEPSIWDFQPAFAGLREQGRTIVRSLPLIGLSLLVLAVAGLITKVAISTTRKSLHRRSRNTLLVNVIARTVGLLVFLFGLYIVFQIAGLTNIALTLLGGTGLLGLVLGIAFRDITENFLASLFLSVQNPFHTGDLVEMEGITGYIQMLTTRATIIMTLDGNHVQIPNATVYKSKIINYTSNPNRRVEFKIGIGYEDPITKAQELALKVLAEHPAVLVDPEPLVLVESLGSATINLQIYFWLDGRQHSPLKVKSAVIRQVKQAFEEAQISMPDEAREMLFPQGITVKLIEPDGEKPKRGSTPKTAPAHDQETISTVAEGRLQSEATEIEEQARHSRPPEKGQNLLDE